MARTSFIDVPDELRNQFSQSIEQRDRYILGVVQSHKKLPSRNKKYQLRGQSLFKFLAPFWMALTPEQKQVWKDAGAYSNISGWQLFISDSAARIRNDLTIGTPPSNLWQVRIGLIEIQSPANKILLKQEHPLDYWIAKKMAGKPWKLELIQIRENFSLPLEIQMRYKSDLSTSGSPQRARFFAELTVSYQGVNRVSQHAIDFSPSVGWTYANLVIDGIKGIIIGYELFIDIEGYQGKILLDNVRSIHGGTNWARDPRFDQMDKIYTKEFKLVQPYWEPVEQPEGAYYQTVFEPIVP